MTNTADLPMLANNRPSVATPITGATATIRLPTVYMAPHHTITRRAPSRVPRVPAPAMSVLLSVALSPYSMSVMM